MTAAADQGGRPAPSNWNLPNALTTLRIVMVPFFVWFAVLGGSFGEASLSAMGELWWWVTIVILVREWGITVMRFAVIRYGVMAASKGGKLKTVLQTIALLFLLIPLVPVVGPWWPWIGWFFMGLATIVTVVTGVDYVVKAYQLRRDSLAAGKPVDNS